jgi:hypothetical protein
VPLRLPRFSSRNEPTPLTATSSQGVLFSKATGVIDAHATNGAEKPSNKC